MLCCEPLHSHPREEMCGGSFLFISVQEKNFKVFTQPIMHCLYFVGTQLVDAYFLLKNLKGEPLAYIGHPHIPNFFSKD